MTQDGQSLFFIGSCTRPLPYFASANGAGLTGVFLDEETGACTRAGVTTGIDNPTYAAISADGRMLYASSEVVDWHEGTLSAYAIDRAGGTLAYVNKAVTRGNVAAQVSLDRSDRFVACVNYAFMPPGAGPDRAVVIFARAPDGGLGPVTAEARLSGHGPDPDRQARSHAHCLRFSRDNRLALVADLGTDRVELFRFDAASGALAPAGAVGLPPGTGPRHIEMHPRRDIAYVVGELNATLATIALDSGAAAGRCLHVAPCLPPGGPPGTHGSAVKISPDGGHLYVGNRGHDSIAHLRVDAGGVARFAGTVPCGGATPRDLALSPSGRVLVVANQDSDRVEVFRRGPDGGLAPLGPGFATGTPTCVAFLP
ncbi:lactonase family protein [Pseudoponticoccus marisrubri]|uniref:6-phosphogluconolactonase n=1 Tax=Pseudoponticoccus marisrubri TaxID=1685382 RepID=A0A0W7WH29_9RHOB|nr:lactonase family protein [Pseudoponticoccus marisrubri]KUF09905.1 hypothetical protein AVJ23_15820 [Pseudoponticoccus marisrubri]